MKTANNLFLLIKSLSKSEKKYFKRFAKLYSNDKPSNYIRLFDYLNKQKNYDETDFKKNFNTSGNKLSVQKEYLFKLILKSLVNSANKSINQFEYKEAVQECEILVSKGLQNYAEKKIISLKKVLYLHGYHLMLIELIGLEKILLKKYSAALQISKLKLLIEEETKLIDQVKILRYILNLQRLLMIELNEAGIPIRDEKNVKKIKVILSKIEAIRIKGNVSFKAKTVLSHALIAAYLSINDFREAYKESLLLLKYLEQFKSSENIDPKNKYAVLHNLVFILLALNKKKKALKNLDNLNLYCSELPKNIAYETRINLRCNLYMINIKSDCILNHLGNRVEYFKEFYRFYEQNKVYLNKKDYLVTIEVLVTNYFVNKEWDKALESNNFLLNKNHNYLNADQIISANIKDLIIHYELNNFNYLSYRILSVKKLLAKYGKKDSYEFQLAELINKLSGIIDNSEKRYLLNFFKRKIEDKAISPADKLSLSENFYLNWINLKLNL